MGHRATRPHQRYIVVVVVNIVVVVGVVNIVVIYCCCCQHDQICKSRGLLRFGDCLGSHAHRAFASGRGFEFQSCCEERNSHNVQAIP